MIFPNCQEFFLDTKNNARQERDVKIDNTKNVFVEGNLKCILAKPKKEAKQK